MRLASPLLASGIAIPLFFIACGPKERPGLHIEDGGAGGASGGGFNVGVPEPCEGPPKPDTATLCGNEVITLGSVKPNLYFLLDTSGSMNEKLPGSARTKLAAAKSALDEVATELGHRMRYGLSHFPGPDPSLEFGGCAPGREVFPTQDGDPILCVNLPPGGDVLDKFQSVLASLKADGGTALNAALTVISPTLLGLENKTAILLLTDGAPNCNPNALCDVDLCMLNVEEASVNGLLCDDSFNCCDPANADQTLLASPGANCVDLDNSVLGVADLAKAGIPTYVIGVPGSETYTDVMNALAVAGGTPRSGSTKYYDVGTEDELLETLSTLGAELTRSCDVLLEKAPASASLVNVYLDATLIAKSDTDGWSLSKKTVSLHGEACDQVKAGKVTQVQVVTGCQTIVK